MFQNFTQTQINTPDATINLVYGGEGPPLLLLHGYPQTHAMWHKVAPQLAEQFTVVIPDLRGYGDSAKPFGQPDHSTYSKRAMAQDLLAVMSTLGFERFAVVGHDRGARVGHRLALDAPERVTKLAVLDIAPTYHVFKTVNQLMATAYYHWFFLIQPYDLPERLIGADPLFYLHWVLNKLGGGLHFFAPAALAEYERCFQNPAMIHASCEDYRAAASIDLIHDEADRQRRLTCPVLALWGKKAFVHHAYEVLAVWQDYAQKVRGKALPSGHFLPEECPVETTAELLAFLND